MPSFNAAWFKNFHSRVSSGARRTALNPMNPRARHRLGLLLLILPISAFAIAQSLRFDIPAQPLPSALKAFADQAKVQLLYRHDAVKGATGNAVVGDFDTREALQTLLKDTGLEVVYSKDNAATIRPMQTASKPIASVPRANEYTRLAQAETSSRVDERASPESLSEGFETRVALEEIVVTAQKRAERLQDVPISISALSGAQLDGSTDRGVADALNRVPGVMSFVSSAGSRSNYIDAIVVRGVSPPVNTGGATAYYLDSIPFGFIRRAFAPDSNAYDLERVEVLRGPQGTLYGLSALNGVVRVLTKDADLDRLEFKARASTSTTERGSQSYRGDVAVNVPVIDQKLAARAVVGYQELGGWVDKPIGKDVNDAKLHNYRLKLNAQPTEQLSIGAFAWFSRSDYGAPSSSADGRVSLSIYDEPSFVDYDAYGLKIGYDFSGVSLASMTSYIDHNQTADVDFSPFAANTFFHQENTSKVVSQELLVTSSRAGPWRWSLGGIYRDAHERGLATQYDPRTGALNSGFLAPIDAETLSESFAVFGELTRAFLDGQIELTAGLRYFEDKTADRELSRFDAPGGVPAAGLINTENKFDDVSPRLVLTWHPDAEITIYASYAEGFRSGLNQGASLRATAPAFGPAEPDNLKNYELGGKGAILDGRLSFDTALFFIDWQGVQQSLRVDVLPGVVLPALVNAESASGIGFEFGTAAQVVDGLTLSAAFSWNELEYDNNVLNGGVVFFPKGARLNSSPEYTIGGSVEYAFALGASGFKGRVSAAANYLPELLSARASATTTFVSDSLLIARASFAMDSPNGWTASLFAENIGDEDGIVAKDQFSTRWDTHPRPRTIGLQFEYRY